MKGIEPKKKWQRLGLNQRPRAYETTQRYQIKNTTYANTHITLISFVNHHIYIIPSF
jgi:hypothetical protein